MAEIIQLDDDDEDFIQSINPSITSRPSSQRDKPSTSKPKRRLPPISTKIESDPILTTEDECPICTKDLSLLNSERRTLHLNKCLDEGESKSEFDKKTEKWTNTIDCPICRTPLQPGPFRSAHIKKCGREHAISGKNLINLVQTQEKISENRRKRSLPHTKEPPPKLRPKKALKLEGEPKSTAEEDLLMAQALSASLIEERKDENDDDDIVRSRDCDRIKDKVDNGVSPKFTRIINENIRKRRSYAVVELAPRSCKCDVMQLVQTRFLQMFKVKGSKKNVDQDVKQVLERAEQRTRRTILEEAMVARKIDRFDALSSSFRSLVDMGEREGDLHIACDNGQSIRAFSWLVLARTTLMGRDKSKLSITLDYPIDIVRSWLRYVCAASVEWSREDCPAMLKLAREHGPDGLVEECRRMMRERSDENDDHSGDGDGQGTSEEGEESIDESVAVDGGVDEPEVTPAVLESTVIRSIESTVIRSPLAPSDSGHSSRTLDDEDPLGALVNVKVAEVPSPLTESFMKALEAPPPPKPDTVDEQEPAPAKIDSTSDTVEREEEIDSFMMSVMKPNTVDVVAGPARGEEEERGILDVSVLRRSPVIRVSGEGTAKDNQGDCSPELFSDDEDDGDKKDQSIDHKDISAKEDIGVTPIRRSARLSLRSLRSLEGDSTSTNNDKKDKSNAEDDVIFIDDTPIRPQAVSRITVAQPSSSKEETTVDPEPSYASREVDATEDSGEIVVEPSYGGGGVDLTYDRAVSYDGEDNNVLMNGGCNEDGNNLYDDYDDGVVYGGYDWNEEKEEEEENGEDERKEEVGKKAVESESNEFDVLGGITPPRRSTVDDESDIHRSDDKNGVEDGPVSNMKTPVVARRAIGKSTRGGGEFGSHVKVLKWTDVTPKPRFESMDDTALKAELTKYGLRPMGRKRAIATLSLIYDETHPVVDEKAASAAASDAPGPSNSLDSEDPDDKTGDSSSDDEKDEDGELGEGALEESMYEPADALPKNIDNMLVLFLDWLREPPQQDLYDHALALRAMSLEELEVKLRRADSALCGISRKALMVVLDRLHITYSLPQDGWKRKRKGK